MVAKTWLFFIFEPHSGELHFRSVYLFSRPRYFLFLFYQDLSQQGLILNLSSIIESFSIERVITL
jgi:hypothetical protein